MSCTNDKKIVECICKRAEKNLPVLCFRILPFKQTEPQCVKRDMDMIQ